MGRTATRLRQIARRLDELAPAERVVIRFVWYDEATGDEEPFGEMAVDGRASRVIQLRWPEDEDDEKRTRQDVPGRA
jgi:hypothetical protein